MIASVAIAEVQSVAGEKVSPGEIEAGGLLRSRPKREVIRRRPSQQQGRSLEMLGHAIEYLVDSDLDRGALGAAGSSVEAVGILMRLSREVFAECAEVVPLWERLRGRMVRFVHAGEHVVSARPVPGPRT